jgi:hypothetical protein
MSYYKYARRGADTRVDWSAISTKLVKTLKDQEADREKQRQEIDKESVAVGKRLADAPQGANKAASTWILNASADAAQLMMTQNRLLKSGIVDPRDFTINRQNVDNSFAALKTIADTANKESELTMKRINEGTSMGFEGVAAQRVNKFQDFSQTRVFWNPEDGVASIGMLENGTLSDNVADFSTIEGAVNQMQARYDKIEYAPTLQKWADNLGENIRVVNKNGVLTVSDAAGRDLAEDDPVRLEVMKSLDDTLSALMVNDIRTLSMAEDLGLVTADDYDLGSEETSWETGLNEAETTRLSELEKIESLGTMQQAELDKLISKRDKPSRKVGVTTQNDGILFPKSNDALNEAVREKLRTDALAMVGYKETARPIFAPKSPTAASIGAGETAQERLGYVEEINTILTDEDSISREALNRRIRTTNEERKANNLSPISEGNITDDSLSITYEDGTTETINLSGNIQKDIVAAYDLLTPKRKGEARPSELELEKYIRDEGLSIGYATDDSGNIIRRVTPLRSSIGVAKIPMTAPDRLLVDSEMVSYDALWKKPLGESLEAIADTNIQVASTFNEILKAPGFMPEEMKRVLEDAGKPYDVKVKGNKMTITIGDTTEEIKDVFNDSATGGTAAVVSLMRDTVIKELNRINNLTSGSDETNETSSNTDAASGGNSGGTVRQ